MCIYVFIKNISFINKYIDLLKSSYFKNEWRIYYELYKEDMILYQQKTKWCYIFYIINYLIKYYNILFDYFKMNKKKYIKDYINNEYCLKSIKQNNNYMKILNILLIIN